MQLLTNEYDMKSQPVDSLSSSSNGGKSQKLDKSSNKN